MNEDPDYIVLFLYGVLVLLFVAVLAQGLQDLSVTQVVHHYPLP